MENQTLKRICIAGAGGVAGIGLTRCLKKDDQLDFVGYDGSVWGEQVMECPFVGDPYISDMIIPVPDGLVKKYAGADNAFLPTAEMVSLCQDKAKTAEILGELAPKTYWVRDTQGAGGAGAQMASEYLPGRNYSVELLYDGAKLLGYFMKERLAYDIKGRKDPLWQRGSSVVSVCINNEDLLNLATEAVWAIAKSLGQVPNGVFAIDFKENSDGVPKITEINPGRFLTASYPYFYETGYNLPLLMVKKFIGEDYTLGDYPLGYGFIRQQDSLPKMFTPEQTKGWL